MRKRHKEPDPRGIRKIGEREEVIVRLLTPQEVDEQRQVVCLVLDRKSSLDEELAKIKADFKQKKAACERQLSVAQRMVRTGKEHFAIDVEEWLLPGNEVAMYRAGTSEEIGKRRIARPHELQEDLPFEEGDDFDNTH